jgi:periplasmic divalent cation tolerance protein
MAALMIVLTTMPDDDRAESLARALVTERLAACVHVQAAMTSVYEWQGQIEVQPERQIVIKTTEDRLPDLEQRLRALHPYELPELVTLEASASAEYSAWVEARTRKS